MAKTKFLTIPVGNITATGGKSGSKNLPRSLLGTEQGEVKFLVADLKIDKIIDTAGCYKIFK